MSPEIRLLPFLRQQDGVVTRAQATQAGVTPRQLRTLLGNGWSRPVRGVFAEPEPADAFRAGLRAALLARPDGIACRSTAARVRELWGLPPWTAAELPQLLFPAETLRAQCRGMRTHFGLLAADRGMSGGFPVATLARTVTDLGAVLALDELVCLVDSALRAGWSPDDLDLVGAPGTRVRKALDLADARSESPLETITRLLLARERIAPEALQFKLFDRNGECYARLDFAWPSVRLAVEADGRGAHDRPEALYGDRSRQNRLMLDGWTVLRFTWFDVHRRPRWVVQQIREALARRWT
jgi:very-short-patch-repair endonuclease